MRRTLAGVIVLALAAPRAHAQAPVTPEPAASAPDPSASTPDPAPPATSAPAEPAVAPPSQVPVAYVPRPRSVMDKRWAIGVDFGPEGLEADAAGADRVEFGQVELAARYRIRRPFELGLALHLGGSNHIAMGGFYIDARYRFMAEQPLNVYALASLGVLAVAHEEGSETEKKGRGSLRLGGGLEYRWNWFALVFELRLVAVGENKDLAVMPAETVGYQLARAKLSGGSLALGANFYF